MKFSDNCGMQTALFFKNCGFYSAVIYLHNDSIAKSPLQLWCRREFRKQFYIRD